MENLKDRIVIVDDDKSIRDSLARALRIENYEVATITNGAAALEFSKKNPPDLWILDVMMPEIDGLTLCRELRANNITTPILMLTAKSQVSERVEGLDAGADDYLTKPFELEELNARIRALLRRISPTSEIICVGDITLDNYNRIVKFKNEVVNLTKTEYELLYLLMRNQNKILNNEDIYMAIWGFNFGKGSKNLAVYINYLKGKLATAGAPDYISNVRGVGYKMSGKVSETKE
jgi:two-component system response regulator MprA